ncbi:hypothetical protein TEA_007352 [Camellia sinensis var. sinensis]|uniref:RING-CH-type domain-containing protein n=1 Tax=Camellia sinensis var. sinensis TaxID=542762 RepID=A0A4S4D651_CAMSN|nr:hypothetical protein TEA_007352 [Camellia sinensis var. sinensis]
MGGELGGATSRNEAIHCLGDFLPIIVMSDHLVLCVDRLITSESLQSLQGAEVSGSSSGEGSYSHMTDPSSSIDMKDGEEHDEADEEEPLIQMVECRICQEEDSIQNLETPCACSGSLKFAHRKCVQRWCNEKGDITCEICHQPYQPGYTAPPPSPGSDDTTIDINGAWTISGSPLDLRDPRILAMAAAERHLLDADYDEYADTNANGAAFCRSAALISKKSNFGNVYSIGANAILAHPDYCIFVSVGCLTSRPLDQNPLLGELSGVYTIWHKLMALLLLRHALTIGNGEDDDDDASTFFSLFLLRVAGFLLPCYIMAWAISILQRRRQRQEAEAAALAATEVAFMIQGAQRRGLQFTIAPGPVGPVPAATPGSVMTPGQAQHLLAELSIFDTVNCTRLLSGGIAMHCLL